MVSFFEHEETGEQYFCIVNLSRQHYEHYNFFCDADKYSIYRVLMNGKKQSRVAIGGEVQEDGFYLYPGQFELFRIAKK